MVNGDDVEVNTIDFDMARKVNGDKPIYDHHTIEGTRYYMAPEILNPMSSATYSKKSDLYALGVMFRDDFGLPETYWQALLHTDPNNRGTIDDLIATIQGQLKATAKPLTSPPPILHMRSPLASQSQPTAAAPSAPAPLKKPTSPRY